MTSAIQIQEIIKFAGTLQNVMFSHYLFPGVDLRASESVSAVLANSKVQNVFPSLHATTNRVLKVQLSLTVRDGI